MNNMLTHVVAEGTGVRARLDDVVVAGKTGTTNNYKDAWFCGFTGNYVGAVWFGNDDYTSMKEMTGGTLPAMTWHDIMAFAHHGVVPRPGYGIDDTFKPAVATGPGQGGVVQVIAAGRPVALSARSAAVIGSIQQLMQTSGRRTATVIVPGRLTEDADVTLRLTEGRVSVQ
jgi:penicillin-binding protein 1A